MGKTDTAQVSNVYHKPTRAPAPKCGRKPPTNGHSHPSSTHSVPSSTNSQRYTLRQRTRKRDYYLSRFFPAGFQVYVARWARQTRGVQVGRRFRGIKCYAIYSTITHPLALRVTTPPQPRLWTTYCQQAKKKVTNGTQGNQSQPVQGRTRD
jgi:hypothetical protein